MSNSFPNPWLNKGQPVTEMPPNCIGFLYVIETHLEKYYIGQCCHKGWQNYGGSGSGIKEYYAEHGKDKVERHIVDFYYDYDELDDAEHSLLKKFEVKENPMFFNLNENIRGRSPKQPSTLIKETAK